ncbi:MAG: hypothetical protein P3W91_000630, partial [Fervidobacterium sp.]|nr:hypothetical protein [Fervidobacterium sp.]
TPIEFIYDRPFGYKAGNVELKKRIYVEDVFQPLEDNYQVIAENEVVRVLYPKIIDRRNGRIEIPPVYMNIRLMNLEYETLVKPRQIIM